MVLDPHPTIENPDPNQMALLTFLSNQTRFGTGPEFGYKTERHPTKSFTFSKNPTGPGSILCVEW
jgi:hypothetical protein